MTYAHFALECYAHGLDIIAARRIGQHADHGAFILAGHISDHSFIPTSPWRLIGTQPNAIVVPQAIGNVYHYRRNP